MPRRETVLEVFVASPGDVQDERDVLEEVIRALNVTWSRKFGIRLDLVRWETHSYPGAGADAQQVINEQISHDDDIFIGIMWTRFGTPTHRAGSGTEEEFEGAYKRHQHSPADVEVMLYFKTAPVSPLDLDLSQLERVRSFRATIENLGVYCRNFNDRDEFQQLVRVHLSRVVQKWIQEDTGGARTQTEQTIAYDPADEAFSVDQDLCEDDELGFLDYVEIIQNSFAHLTDFAERAAAHTKHVGERMKLRADEINRIGPLQRLSDTREAKRVIAKAAADLKNYSSLIEPEIMTFAESFKQGAHGFQMMLRVSGDFQQIKDHNDDKLLKSVEEMKIAIDVTQDDVQGLRDSISRLPRMTGHFNRAKRHALAALSNLLEEFAKASNLSTEMAATIREITH